MEIRYLNTDDASQWLRLRLEALKGDPEAFSASLEEYQSLSVEEVKRRLWSSADAFVVGAAEDGTLVGMGGFYREQGLKTRHKGHVWGVYVTPPARGKNVGRALMEKLLERAWKVKGVEQILISVTSTQTAAIKLYRALGFERFGLEPEALKVRDRFIDEEYMVMRRGHTNQL